MVKHIIFIMKIFGFSTNNEKRFIHITCNIILGIILAVVFSLSLFSPVSSVVSVTKQTPIYYGNKNSNKVSLMFNVYWGTEYLDSIISTLKSNNVKTTFFVGGCWVAKNNEMLKKLDEEGFEIASHGYNHKDHAKLSAQQNQDEIYVTHELVKSVIGKDMNLFAPPSGSFNDSTLTVATVLGYKTIMWSRDTIDWRDKDENLIYSRAVDKTVGGDLILMHPTEKTAKALDKIIKALKNKGLVITTVTDCIS